MGCLGGVNDQTYIFSLLLRLQEVYDWTPVYSVLYAFIPSFQQGLSLSLATFLFLWQQTPLPTSACLSQPPDLDYYACLSQSLDLDHYYHFFLSFYWLVTQLCWPILQANCQKTASHYSWHPRRRRFSTASVMRTWRRRTPSRSSPSRKSWTTCAFEPQSQTSTPSSRRFWSVHLGLDWFGTGVGCMLFILGYVG